MWQGTLAGLPSKRTWSGKGEEANVVTWVVVLCTAVEQAGGTGDPE